MSAEVQHADVPLLLIGALPNRPVRMSDRPIVIDRLRKPVSGQELQRCIRALSAYQMWRSAFVTEQRDDVHTKYPTSSGRVRARVTEHTPSVGLHGRRATVNAAFLQEVHEDDRRLKRSLQQMCRLCEAHPRDANARCQIVHQLRRLREHLAFHFALEEAYGYFDEPLCESPALGGEAEQLLAEHTRFTADANALVATALPCLERGDDQPLVERLVIAIRAFLDRLRQHEQRENLLIQRAYGLDLGVGD